MDKEVKEVKEEQTDDLLEDLDIEESHAIKGIKGKSILIYGPNKTGKTYNAAHAEKPLFLSFEKGLTAINGVPYIRIDKWRKFRLFCKQISDKETAAKLKKNYETIVVDALDDYQSTSENYVCSSLGINAIREYNGGYGAWGEWAKELRSQTLLLVSAGFTVVFIGHKGEREFPDGNGGTYKQIYPRGDKRVIDPILNFVDITCYTDFASYDENGQQPLSTLYLKGNRAFFAGSRFRGLPDAISEWTWAKLDEALRKAIDSEAGTDGITVDEALELEHKDEQKAKAGQMPIQTLINGIGRMRQQSMLSATDKDHMCDEYNSIVVEVTGNPAFKCSAAGEAQREQLEGIYDALKEKGYDPNFTPKKA